MNQTTHLLKQPAPSADNVDHDKDQPTKKATSLNQLLLGVLFGVIFGFLLQKGGVAKYHVLLGALLLRRCFVEKTRWSQTCARDCGMCAPFQSNGGVAA